MTTRATLCENEAGTAPPSCKPTIRPFTKPRKIGRPSDDPIELCVRHRTPRSRSCSKKSDEMIGDGCACRRHTHESPHSNDPESAFEELMVAEELVEL
jgi:hypothetical protein